MKRSLLLIALALSAIAATQTALGPSKETKKAMQEIIPSKDFEQTPVRKAIFDTLAVKGLEVQIAKDVQGNVTLVLRKCSRETILQNVLRQVDATYRLRGDRVEIMRKAQDVAPISAEEDSSDRASSKCVYSYVGVPVRTALATLFQSNEVSYTLTPALMGNVSVVIGEKSFETTLQEILKQVNATYLVEGGVYEIVLRGG